MSCLQNFSDLAGGQTVLHNKLPQPYTTATIPRATAQSKSWRYDVPIILPGWELHTGGSWSKPTVHPCLVRQGGCGLLTQQHSTDAQMSPTLQHGSGATVATVPQSLRSVHKTRQDETVCVTVIPYQNLWLRSVQRASDPVTDRVMDRSVVQRVVLPSGDPEDRGDPTNSVPGVPEQGEG